jgi:hypothetical protein
MQGRIRIRVSVIEKVKSQKSKVKSQKSKGKRQKAKGKRQKAKVKRQKSKVKRQKGSSLRAMRSKLKKPQVLLPDCFASLAMTMRNYVFQMDSPP